MSAPEIITIILASLGMLFMLASFIGMIRFPDFFTRLHAQGVGDTLGAFMLLAAMMTAAGAGLMTVKIFLIFVIILLTNPIGTNLMMIAAVHHEDYLDYNSTKKKAAAADPENDIEEKRGEEE